MNKNLKEPIWTQVLLVAVLVAVTCLMAVSGLDADTQSKRELYDLSVKPGAVTYGTHTAPVMPMTSVSHHRSVMPTISSAEMRSYAHPLQPTTPSALTGSTYRIYTTSSATSRTGGSGSVNSGMGTTGGGSSSSSLSSSSTSYSGGFAAASMPSMAFASTGNAVSASTIAMASTQMTGGPRRVNPHAGDTGTEGDKYQDTENPSIWWYWSEAEEGWISGDPPVGATKEEGGQVYEWNGSSWVLKGNVSDLGTPVGDTPWLILLLLLAAYASLRRRRSDYSE